MIWVLVAWFGAAPPPHPEVARPQLYLGVGIDHVPASPIPSRPADRRLPRPVA